MSEAGELADAERMRERGCSAKVSLCYGVVFVLLGTAVGGATAVTPRQYAAQVTIGMEPVPRADPDERGPCTLGIDHVEHRILMSLEVRHSVIDALGLLSKWHLASTSEASDRLATMISSTESRGEGLFKIVVHSTGKNEAAEVANAIADAYVVRRNSLESEVLEAARKDLRRALLKQERRVDAARTRMQQLEARRLRNDGENQLRDTPAADAEYQQAKDDYSVQTELLQKRVEGQEKALASLSRLKRPATVQERATPPSTHAKPNVPLQATIALASLLAGAVLLVGGFMVHSHRARPAISAV